MKKSIKVEWIPKTAEINFHLVLTVEDGEDLLSYDIIWDGEPPHPPLASGIVRMIKSAYYLGKGLTGDEVNELTKDSS